MEIKGLKKIAEGGQALVYEIDDQKVLRVLRRREDERLLHIEAESMKTLFKQGIPVPEIFGITEADGKPALIMERINGASMMEIIQRNPFKTWRTGKELAELHIKLAGCKAPEEMITSLHRARYILEKNTFLNKEQKDFISSLIGGLQDGEELLHGDFHPGNILVSCGRFYIIDWMGASKGSIVSDAAHSFLIMKNVPRIPGISGFKFTAMRIIGSILAKSYLKKMRERLNFDMAVFSKWMCVMAAERTFYGHPNEKSTLIRFIEACRRNSENPEGWYLMI